MLGPFVRVVELHGKLGLPDLFNQKLIDLTLNGLIARDVNEHRAGPVDVAAQIADRVAEQKGVCCMRQAHREDISRSDDLCPSGINCSTSSSSCRPSVLTSSAVPKVCTLQRSW